MKKKKVSSFTISYPLGNSQHGPKTEFKRGLFHAAFEIQNSANLCDIGECNVQKQHVLSLYLLSEHSSACISGQK